MFLVAHPSHLIPPELVREITAGASEFAEDDPDGRRGPSPPALSRASNGAACKGRELVDAGEFARRLGIERSWVYSHAIELGAVKLGSGPKPRLRFDPQIVAGVLRKVGERTAPIRPPAQVSGGPAFCRRRERGGTASDLWRSGERATARGLGSHASPRQDR